MSATIGELTKALSKAQGVMHGAKKENVNPAFRSKYADLASVWEACRKPLSDNGLAVVQTMRPVPDGAHVVTTLLHTSGEWVRSELFIPSTKKDAHGVGSACTYARRFALAAMVGIAPEDDDANEAAQPSPQRGPIKAPTPPEGVEYALGQSVDMLKECVSLNEKLAAAKTMGEVQEAWAGVSALQKRGLPRSHVESLRALKDKRKAELQPVNGAA
jgi:hypothetical protein